MDRKLYCVNKRISRVDAWEKVNGHAMYGNDLMFDNMLYLKSVHSKYAHARILSIDTRKARAFPGVACVLTARDIPGKKMTGELVQDQYAIADDKVRYLGDVVAVVAAETQEMANEAAELVRVCYEPLPALFDPEQAMVDKTVITEQYEGVSEHYEGNVCGHYHSRKGDFQQAEGAADVKVETQYATQHVEHAYIEPEVLIAVPSEHGDALTIHGSMQNPFMVRTSVARVLALPQAKVRVVQSNLGGTFGGKLEAAEPPAIRAALCALLTGRPVKCALTREESILESHKRHPIQFRHKLIATGDGEITGLKFRALGDSGAYVIMSRCVMWKILTLGAGPYRIPNVDIESICVTTNNVPTGSMRGFGTPQMIFAMENTMDEMAETMGVSPLWLRRKNILHTGDTSPAGHTITTHEVSALQVLDKAAERIDYEEKYWKYRRENSGLIRRGVGIAVSMRGVSTGAEGLDVGRVYIEVEKDGSINVAMGLTEQGQGLRTVMTQITAEALGARIEQVNVTLCDTDRAPDTGAAIASRGTYIGGNAILDAAKRIHAIINDALKRHYQVEVEPCFEHGRVMLGDVELSFEEAISLCYQQGLTPAANGTYVNHILSWDEEQGQGEPFCTYTYSCHAAEVEVNLGTGKVEVLKMVGVHDAGRVINEQGALGQVYGGLVMGEGMALTENLNIRDGCIKNRNFDTYIIPTVLDVPDSNEAYMIENPDPRGPFGAKSLGEPSTEPSAAAISCAVNMALHGVGRIRKLPMDLEKVLMCGMGGMQR